MEEKEKVELVVEEDEVEEKEDFTSEKVDYKNISVEEELEEEKAKSHYTLKQT